MTKGDAEQPVAEASNIPGNGEKSEESSGSVVKGDKLTDDMLAELAPELEPNSAGMTVLRAVRDLQNEHDEIFEQYVKEKLALEARYDKRFAPVAGRRHDTLSNGELPDFWPRAFENCEIVSNNVTDKDALALAYLTDVSCENITADTASSRTDDLGAGSFILRFRFRENPFFRNELLTKTYAVKNFDDFPTAKGCEISWKQGKDLTVKIFRKKAKNGKTLVRSQPTDSFFNFFAPPKVPPPNDKDDEDLRSELESVLEADVELGEAIGNDLVPRALYYYLDIGEEDDDDDDDDDDEEEAKDGEDSEEGDDSEKGGDGGCDNECRTNCCSR